MEFDRKKKNENFYPQIQIEEIDVLKNNIESWLNIFYQDNDSKKIIEQIQKDSIKLESISSISQGLIAYDKYVGHSKETIKNRIWHSDKKENETYKKELKGGDVKRYSLEWNGKRWISYGEWLAHPRDSKFFTKERILVREITNPTIMACYTKDEFYNTPSIINITDFKEISIFYILGIINSTLISYYHNKKSPKANKGDFPKIIVKDIKNLPIKIPENEVLMNEVIDLVKSMIKENDETKKINFEEKINAKLTKSIVIKEEGAVALTLFANVIAPSLFFLK